MGNRQTAKINRQIQSSSSLCKISKLLQDKWDLEVQFKSQYNGLKRQEEEEAVNNIKKNSKAFFSFDSSTRAADLLAPNAKNSLPSVSDSNLIILTNFIAT